eukprot:6179632-Pleurochrysis_carterae.AAC.2
MRCVRSQARRSALASRACSFEARAPAAPSARACARATGWKRWRCSPPLALRSTAASAKLPKQSECTRERAARAEERAEQQRVHGREGLFHPVIDISKVVERKRARCDTSQAERYQHKRPLLPHRPAKRTDKPRDQGDEQELGANPGARDGTELALPHPEIVKCECEHVEARREATPLGGRLKALKDAQRRQRDASDANREGKGVEDQQQSSLSRRTKAGARAPLLGFARAPVQHQRLHHDKARQRE